MKKKLSAVILILCIILGNCIYITQAAVRIPQNVADVVKDMKLGWNLGNTLDSIDAKRAHDVVASETLWGNPVTTKQMIQMVADAGFDAVRVPVTYYDNSDENANIDELWLDRVEEVVNYVLDSGMYCIINVHHDVGKGAWITADESKYEDSSYRLKTLWEQIAQRFQSYDNRLLFEGFNELLDSKNTWDNASESAYEMTNKLNQLFVDTVRTSGGNNTQRYLITNLYAGLALNAGVVKFKIPHDITENHIIVGFHMYNTNENEISEIFDRVKVNFIDEGIPVILGEFGMQNNKSNDNTKIRCDYAAKIISEAKKLGISCFWWDNGGKFDSNKSVNNYALLDRYNMKWYFPEIVNVMMQTIEEKEEEPDNSQESSAELSSSSQSNSTEMTSSDQQNSIREVESLKVTGINKGIKTDIVVGMESEYELVISIPNANDYGTVMSVKNAATDCYRVRHEKEELYVKYGYINSNVAKMENNITYIIKQQGRNIYMNGKLVKVSSSQTFEDGQLELGQSSMNFYGMIIKNQGKVVHELVPAVDKSGVGCILDKISGKIYYSSEKIEYTEFSTEEDKEQPEESSEQLEISTQPTESVEQENPSMQPEESSEQSTSSEQIAEIPSLQDVQEIEFLEISRLNKSIKTDIMLGMNSEYELKVSVSNIDTYGTMMLVRNNSTDCYRVRHEKEELYVKYGYINTNTIKMENDKIYVIGQSGRKIYINGEIAKTSSYQDFEEGLLEIGQSKMKFYGMTIKERNTIVHQLVPAMDAEGRVCILDKITGRIYY